MKTWIRDLNWMKSQFNEAARYGLKERFILLDTETTGLRNDDEPIEITLIRVGYSRDRGFYVADTLDIFVKPSKHVPKEASDVHHITDEMLADKPTAKEALPEVEGFMGDNPAIGAYNLPFDLKMLKGFYGRCGKEFKPAFQFDLLTAAKDCLCSQKMKDHKLATVCNYYGVDDEVQRYHSSLEDTKVLVKLMNAMLDDVRENGDAAPKKNLTLYRLNYWPGYKGNSRIYAVTSGGSIYYDVRADRWASGNGALDISDVNMDDLEAQVFETASADPRWSLAPGEKSYRELCRICRNGAFSSEAAS